jgi:restriction system protein
MARRKDNILDVFVEMPWQFSVGMAAVVFVVFKFILPLFSFENYVIEAFATSLNRYAHFIALFLLLPAPVSALNARRKRKQLEDQKDIQSIRALHWKDFEELIAEAYRRKGYSVTENPNVGADGGVDVRMTKDGELHLVQCKQWKSNKVGAAIVREMYGIMTAENAASVIVVTSGSFTKDARKFAAGKPIKLIDGPNLVSLISGVQTSGNIAPTVDPQLNRSCPHCGGSLVKRTAKKGVNAGKVFRGCSNFPKCRYTEPNIND